MRPTFSIIFFTVASGTGYGIWFLLGLGLAVYWPTCAAPGPKGPEGVSLRLCTYPLLIDYMLAAGFVLVTTGLLSSLGHLGKPRRAWRALSQWRSSWLSREGVAALLTYLPAIGVVLPTITGWWQTRTPSPTDAFTPWFSFEALRPIGVALALGALVTVYCTAHIYSSLKPIRAWHNRYVTPAYLLFALYGGLLWLWALSTLPSGFIAVATRTFETHATHAALAITAAACALLKFFYWRDIDRTPPISAGRATGLDALGTVRTFEQPHTEENYLTHEMGFVLARAHSRRLRAIALLSAFLAPALIAGAAALLPFASNILAWPALAFGMLGLLVERWLFFAEAKHAVIGYYQR